MAVTKILARRAGLAQAIAYVVNGDKTEEQVLTATQGCSIGSACAEMQDAKIRWNKTDGVQLYAQRMGVSQRAVIKRRDRILRSLKKFIWKSTRQIGI